MAGGMKRNSASSTSASRSIRKISITGFTDSSQAALKTLRPHSKNTNNNNKNTAATAQLFRTVGEKTPSYTKLLLCRDDEQDSSEYTTGWLFNRDRCLEDQQTSMIKS